MARLSVGDAAPDFEAQTQTGQLVRLADHRGKSAVVLFFYPMDNSPTCTAEACSFRDAYEDFAAAGAVVIGISGDSLASHRRFAEGRKLSYPLVSDADGSIRRMFGVSKILGMLPERVTFVIDKDGVIRHVFRSQFSGRAHMQEALEAVKRLQGMNVRGVE